MSKTQQLLTHAIQFQGTSVLWSTGLKSHHDLCTERVSIKSVYIIYVCTLFKLEETGLNLSRPVSVYN